VKLPVNAQWVVQAPPSITTGSVPRIARRVNSIKMLVSVMETRYVLHYLKRLSGPVTNFSFSLKFSLNSCGFFIL
jgi:hypothetical protein